MNGYEKRTLNKRESILNAARDLFAARGIAAVSITDIAEKANVSRVTLFKYFGDKETLAREVLYTWIERLMDEYDKILNSDMPFQQKILAFLSVKVKSWDSMGNQYVNNTAWDDPEIQRLIAELTVSHGLPKIIEFIEQGKHAGYIEASLDNEAILAFFSVFGPIVKNTDYIKKGKAFQTSMYNLFMGGLIKNWYEITGKES